VADLLTQITQIFFAYATQRALRFTSRSLRSNYQPHLPDSGENYTNYTNQICVICASVANLLTQLSQIILRAVESYEKINYTNGLAVAYLKPLWALLPMKAEIRTATNSLN
jgi:hypothetical protein